VKLPNITDKVDRCRSTDSNPYQVNDVVYVKPVHAKCTTVWREGKVSKVISNAAVEVDGMTRHVGDIRLARRPVDDGVVYDSHSCFDVEIDISDTVSEADMDNVGELADIGNEQVDIVDNDNGANIVVENDNAAAVTDRQLRSEEGRRPPQWLADFQW
jgi:hypothetical protein